ncbi:hypothetical protein COB21_05640 [Candidatus Aerophobetes bacterium]|uniref:Uncharacterized protein n=1 Tax=Aerophobetes bacterium TaxID=2030807 RepID=A0A2A4WYN5_UNCAE|nr:MAG: hypothetical protein COB21_05640 [Candidatus Aerophobetes bacterium]
MSGLVSYGSNFTNAGVSPSDFSWLLLEDGFQEISTRVWDVAQSAIEHMVSRFPSFTFPGANGALTGAEGELQSVVKGVQEKLNPELSSEMTIFLTVVAPLEDREVVEIANHLSRRINNSEGTTAFWNAGVIADIAKLFQKYHLESMQRQAMSSLSLQGLIKSGEVDNPAYTFLYEKFTQNGVALKRSAETMNLVRDNMVTKQQLKQYGGADSLEVKELVALVGHVSNRLTHVGCFWEKGLVSKVIEVACTRLANPMHEQEIVIDLIRGSARVSPETTQRLAALKEARRIQQHMLGLEELEKYIFKNQNFS